MQEAQDQMSTYNFRHLPVVENDRIIGMLSAVRWKEAVSEINLLRDMVAASRHARDFRVTPESPFSVF